MLWHGGLRPARWRWPHPKPKERVGSKGGNRRRACQGQAPDNTGLTHSPPTKAQAPPPSPAAASQEPTSSKPSNHPSAIETTPSPTKPPAQPPLMKYQPKDYRWEDEDDEPMLQQMGPHLFTLDRELLTQPFPQGFNFTEECLEWLPRLGIYTWEDLIFMAEESTVETLMTTLTVDYYYKNRKDLRILMSFGKICNPRHHRTSPKPNNKQTWMPHLIKQIQHDLTTKSHSKLERKTVNLLYSQRGSENSTPPEEFGAVATPRRLLGTPPNNTKQRGVNPVNPSHPSQTQQTLLPETPQSEYTEKTIHSIHSIPSTTPGSRTEAWKPQEILPRGNGFPAHEKSIRIRGSHPEDDVSRLETSHMSYSNMYPKILKNHLPAKIQWDGTTTGFQEYKAAIEGFYVQSYSGYLFDEKFQELYIKHGPAETIDHPLLPRYIKITRPQLEEAKVHLFGAIQHSTKKSNTVKKYINKYRRETDGIKVWIDLSATQDNDGNKQVREARLTRITTQEYDRNYPGRLMKYLDDIDDAYSGLDMLNAGYTMHQKMQKLLNNNLQFSPSDNYLNL